MTVNNINYFETFDTNKKYVFSIWKFAAWCNRSGVDDETYLDILSRVRDGDQVKINDPIKGFCKNQIVFVMWCREVFQ